MRLLAHNGDLITTNVLMILDFMSLLVRLVLPLSLTSLHFLLQRVLSR
jgi:hypothetical protein